ncbi:MAG: hypothetical protein ACLFQJ_08055, partial [Campylobacterales bacterium]
IDFLLQQVDMQYEDNYQNIAQSVATDVFSKIFGVSHKSADEFVTKGFEINCTDRGYEMLTLGGHSLLKWLQGDKVASMKLNELLRD